MKKKTLYLVIPVILILLFSSCNFFEKSEKSTCNNLFLVYMAGDNSLNKTVYTDLEEMKKGLNTENDIILVLANRYSSNFYEDEWNEARLFQISYEKEEIKVIELEDEKLGISIKWLDDNIDSGSGTTLKSFLLYANEHYDFNKVYLDLWNHGGGWKSGDSYSEISTKSSRNICSDEGSRNSLSPKEMSSAIKTSKINHFEIIMMDACSMASVEVASELIGLTDTLIFSQDVIPEDGFPYDRVVPALFSKENTYDKCLKICELYTQSYNKDKTTISAFKIDQDMKNFLLSLENYVSLFTNFDLITENRSYCYEFLKDVVDLDLILNDEMKNKYKNILIYNSSNYNCGISIYFPPFFNYSKESWEYTAERLSFLKFCPSYLDFLLNYEKNSSSCEVIDFYEPNNFKIDSYVINLPANKVVSYLWCMSDEDWYMLNSANEITQITLISPDDIECNLSVLLYKNGVLIESLYENEQNTVILYSYDFDNIFIKVYSAFGYYSQEEPYTLKLE